EEHVERQRPSRVEAEENRGVGADGHEARVGEGELAGIEGDEDGDRQDGVDPHLRHQQLVRVVEADWIGQQLDEEVHSILQRRSRNLVPKRRRPSPPRAEEMTGWKRRSGPRLCPEGWLPYGSRPRPAALVPPA